MDRYIGIDVRAPSCTIAVVDARGKQVFSLVVTCVSLAGCSTIFHMASRGWQLRQ